jgi:hypothetical protein
LAYGVRSLGKVYSIGWKQEKIKEEFADAKVVIRIHKPKKERQDNDQMKKDKRTNKDLTVNMLNVQIKFDYGGLSPINYWIRNPQLQDEYNYQLGENTELYLD